MKYLKRFNEGKGEGILYDIYSRFDEGELRNLLEYYFEDEFDYLNCYLEDSHASDGMQNSIEYDYLTKKSAEYLMDNTFMLEFSLDYKDWWDKPRITPFVGKLTHQLELFNQHIKSYDLKVVFHEYGLGETSYEAFISDINFEFNPKMK